MVTQGIGEFMARDWEAVRDAKDTYWRDRVALLGAIEAFRPADALRSLIVAKILAGRPKDVEDARTLWRLHGRDLDAGHIRQALERLEEALGQSDLVLHFNAMASGKTPSAGTA